MKTEVSPLLKVVLFLNNENIDIIPRIYQGKVEDHIIPISWIVPGITER